MFMILCPSADFVKIQFSKNNFRSTITVSKVLIKIRFNFFVTFVKPDLGQNCLKMSTADYTSRRRINVSAVSGGNGMRGSYLNCGLVQIWIFMSSIGMVNTIT